MLLFPIKEIENPILTASSLGIWKLFVTSVTSLLEWMILGCLVLYFNYRYVLLEITEQL